MQYTSNLGLKKPELTDYVDIADLNFNVQAMDEYSAQVDAEIGMISDTLDAINGEVV